MRKTDLNPIMTLIVAGENLTRDEINEAIDDANVVQRYGPKLQAGSQIGLRCGSSEQVFLGAVWENQVAYMFICLNSKACTKKGGRQVLTNCLCDYKTLSLLLSFRGFSFSIRQVDAILIFGKPLKK